MKKKTKGLMISAVLAATSVILPHAPKIIPEGNSLTAAAVVAATLSIPAESAAAIMPARIVQIAVTMPQSCEAGVMEQLCSSVTSFLDDEAAKADTALKNCKKNCGWKKRKDDLIDAARKKAKDSCAKGEAPDINELNNGLDTDAKARLKSLYDRNSRMFDGTAKLAVKESEKNSDVSVTVTVAGGASATKKLTIRRPKFISHPPLQFKISRDLVTRKYNIGTPDKFKWTLTDQLPTASYPSGRPLANVAVTEIVTFDLSKPHSINPEDANWPAVGFKKITATTNASGQINDEYVIPTSIVPDRIEIHLNQKLIVAGYSGMSDITITDEQVTGRTPVELQ
ncbi:MAG: hypothetical protein HY796_12165 [Elusimicrobia bacterium]|nr:hypothetical protein [Elusimicrobiota bacterium]